MREILFRGKTLGGEWVEGHYFYDPRPYGGHFILRHHAYSEDATEVIPSTIGQFTGLHDRDGKRIFEGDRIEYFTYKMYTQQSHPDIAPEICEPVLIKKSGVVVFEEFEFRVGECNLNYIGFSTVQELKEVFFGDGQGLTEEEMECDIDGNELNANCTGIIIIGNIHES